MKKLTEKQELFARYCVELNCNSAAYRKAYNAGKMSDAIIARKAYEVANLPHVAARINQLKAERNKRMEINADYVLRRLIEIDQMDVADILNDDGSLKGIGDWPKCWRTTLSGLDINTTITNFDETTTENILKKIKWPDKVKNLELLGKHVTVNAFRENVDHSSKDGSMTPKGALDVRSLSDSTMAEILKARDDSDE